MRWFTTRGICILAACVFVSMPAEAQVRKGQPANPQDLNQIKERMNLNTVVIAAGNPNGSDLAAAYDLSTVLDDGDNLRVLAFMGKGGAQNVRDALWLKNVDMAITQANVMAHFRKTSELGPNLEGRLVYVTTLFNEELHVVAGPSINSLRDLDGKTVNFAEAGSGTQLTARLLFETLKINVTEVNLTVADALLKIKSGEIAATMLLAGKPAAALERIASDGELKLVSIPYDEELETDYLPSKLSAADYPALLAEGESIETIAVPSVLAAYNWGVGSDRQRRLARFVEAFFGKFPEFRKQPRHPKWHEVNLSAELKGWRRFPAAQAWLDARKPQTAAAPAAPAQPERRDFERFLAEQRGQPGAGARGGRNTEEAMFQRFLEWSRRQGGGSSGSASVAPAATSQPTAAPAQAPAAAPGTRLW